MKGIAMTARLALTAAAACLLAQGVPAASAQTDTPAAPQTSALMQSCSAHKFETTVRYVAAGTTHSSKVKLCGTAGQSEAEWIGTLEDAADKIRADADMPPAKRDKIVAALTAEIARVQSGAAPAAATASILPSLKTADPTPPARDPLSGYTVFKPLPPPPPPRKSASVAAGTVAAAAAAPALPAPQLTIRCGDLINRRVDETCTSLEPETVLMVRADEKLPAGLSLRFMRRGDARGEVALARLAQGQSVRVRPPKALCAGIVHSSAEIQLLRQGSGGESVVDTMGPYELRC
jgi:hypothetical protein